MTWFKNCVITSITSKATRGTVPAQGGNPAVAAVATFRIKDTKLYLPVITLSVQDGNKLLEQLKTGFRRTIKWNKYRSEMSNQAKNKNLNYLIDPTF